MVVADELKAPRDDEWWAERPARNIGPSAVRLTRRDFLASVVGAGTALATRLTAAARSPLARRFADLRRHFVFEYYAWYGANPVQHWDQDRRRTPIDVASNYMPRLGAYTSGSRAVMDQHAKWIKDSGAGAINVSWWGRGSDVDRLVPSLMDVMAAHDLRVTFHLEPYRDRHALSYAEDIEYLIKEYGEKRRWDCLLLLEDAGGGRGPVFKSFRTILPETTTDCHGKVEAVRDHAPDATWREQTDRVRRTFAADFDHVTLLADSLDWERTKRSGFDGIAVYDNYVRPSAWRACAEACSERDLVFSFNINPGFDGIAMRDVPAGACYQPPAIEPPAARSYEWTRSRDAGDAAAASERRIRESFSETISLQSDAALSNAKRGFFLVYLNSFNEWHEGHQFEPMKDRRRLTDDERAVGYHNPDDGRYRLKLLKRLLSGVLSR